MSRWALSALLVTLGCTGAVEPELGLWEGSLNPVPPASVFGRVAAVTQFGRMRVSIVLEGGERGLSYGWRVDAGTCQGSGSIQGGAALYPALVAGNEGAAEAVADLATPFKVGDLYAARVFLAGVGGGEQVVACGDLRPAG